MITIGTFQKLYPSCYSTVQYFSSNLHFLKMERDKSNHNVTISHCQVVVANTINLRRILDMISQSFAGTDFRCLDQNTPENIRDWVNHYIFCTLFCTIPRQFEWISPQKYVSVLFCSVLRPIFILCLFLV